MFGYAKNCCNFPKIWTVWHYHRVMSPKDADGMANSVDPDQTALLLLEGQSDLGLCCFPRPICPKTWDRYCSCRKWKFEPQHDKTNKMTTLSEDSDQPGHSPRLIRVFAVRMKKAWVLSHPLSAQRRLGAQPHCWFCHIAAHLRIIFNISSH